MTKQEYIANWHDSFVAYVKQWRDIIGALMILPEATDKDKHGLELYRLILDGKDARDIEKSLASGTVNKEVLNKIEKLDLVDTAVEHLHTDVLIKEFWKRIMYIRIEQGRKDEENRLSILNISFQ